MPATLEELGLDKWSVEERRWLIEQLQISIGDGEDVIPDWHKDIINERLDDMDRNPKPLIPWEEGRARIWGPR